MAGSEDTEMELSKPSATIDNLPQELIDKTITHLLPTDGHHGDSWAALQHLVSLRRIKKFQAAIDDRLQAIVADNIPLITNIEAGLNVGHDIDGQKWLAATPILRRFKTVIVSVHIEDSYQRNMAHHFDVQFTLEADEAIWALTDAVWPQRRDFDKGFPCDRRIWEDCRMTEIFIKRRLCVSPSADGISLRLISRLVDCLVLGVRAVWPAAWSCLKHGQEVEADD